jgi:hypothetical protein
MPAQPAIRVLFRFHLGLPFRKASEEEKKKVGDLLGEIFQEWKSSGIKLIGTFGSPAHVSGFASYMIFEVDDLSKVGKMDQSIFRGEVGRFIEDFQVHIGIARTAIEDMWKP